MKQSRYSQNITFINYKTSFGLQTFFSGELTTVIFQFQSSNKMVIKQHCSSIRNLLVRILLCLHVSPIFFKMSIDINNQGFVLKTLHSIEFQSKV